MKYFLAFLLATILAFGVANAVTLSNTSLNASGANIVLTFNTSITADLVNVTSTQISLYNVTVNNSVGSVRSTVINLTTGNTTTDSSSFPVLASSGSNVKTITSGLASTVSTFVNLSTGGTVPSTPRITFPNGSSEYPSYLYDSVGGTITFDATIPPGVSTVTLNDAQAVVSDICFGNAKGLDSIGSSLPVFGGLFVLIVVVGLLGGLGVVSLPLGIGWREIVVGLVVLVCCMVVISFLGGVLTPVPC